MDVKKKKIQFNTIRLETKLTIDASGYTWEGLCEKRRQEKEK